MKPFWARLHDPRGLVLIWALYALGMLGWFAYREAMSNFFCGVQ